MLLNIYWVKFWKRLNFSWNISDISNNLLVSPEKIIVWNDVFIWKGFYCNAFNWVIIWDDVMISHNVAIISANHEVSKFNWVIERLKYTKDKPITIKNWVWIGYNVTILPWVTIWKNSILWAMTVVTKDVPDNSTVVWNPGRII